LGFYLLYWILNFLLNFQDDSVLTFHLRTHVAKFRRTINYLTIQLFWSLNHEDNCSNKRQKVHPVDFLLKQHQVIQFQEFSFVFLWLFSSQNLLCFNSCYKILCYFIIQLGYSKQFIFQIRNDHFLLKI